MERRRSMGGIYETMHAVFVEYFLFGIYVGGMFGTAGMIVVMNKLHGFPPWERRATIMTVGWPLFVPIAIVMADEFHP